jgi:geranylgeranyl pyrophosphate synthase
MQRLLAAEHLPEGALDAAGTFMAFHLEAARFALSEPDCTALAIILAPAAHDHADWRRALARDLAQALAIMARHGAIDAARADALAWAARARAALQGLPDHPLKVMLDDLAGYVVARVS